MAGGECFRLVSTEKEFGPREHNVLSPNSFKILLCLTSRHITEQSAQNVSSTGSVTSQSFRTAIGLSGTGHSASGKRRVLGSSKSPKILM